MTKRLRIEAAGVLQGIGFRPFVYRLARALDLSGYILNDGQGVVICVQGNKTVLDRFVSRLKKEIPAGGRFDRLNLSTIALEEASTFVIKESNKNSEIQMTLVADRYVCKACIEEMNTKSDRRYRYPFINCTHCGPRYTITNTLPYDRPMTTMADFPMCTDCDAEYRNPDNRRYHAEPIACPLCGPRAWLHFPDTGSDTIPPPTSDPQASAFAVERAALYLKEGRIVAIKGMGGFHLAVDAASKVAVMRLRAVKQRKRKPFALMVRDLETALDLVELDVEAQTLLQGPAAPIVIAPTHGENKAPLAQWIAPGIDDIGVMLPYTPLHHLLLHHGPRALVMTSGNPPAEPIAIDNRDAQETLKADMYLMHNRKIAVANDDSVVRTGPYGPIFIRRSRGYVPTPFDVSYLDLPSTLALGALLKVTLATLHQGQLVVGRHLGDLDNERSEDAFFDEIERMLTFGRFMPERIAVDSHPDLPSTRYATDRFDGIPIVRVQHHHAHLAAVMIEHRIPADAEITGVLLDGFGFGSDGTLWGGEVLRGGFDQFERIAYLRPIPQPGGDRAAKEPHRMATSLLFDAEMTHLDHPAFSEEIAGICDCQAVSPMTSSAGRLFDGVAALLNITPHVQDFEGEAAARVETHANPLIDDAYPLPQTGGVLDTRIMIRALLDDPAPTPVKAARFINGLADGLVDAACTTGDNTIALGGGSMVNRLLVRRLVDRLKKHGKTVLTAKQLPPGDGGVSAGQAVIAACQLPEERK